jgi:hypothetical protein
MSESLNNEDWSPEEIADLLGGAEAFEFAAEWAAKYERRSLAQKAKWESPNTLGNMLRAVLGNILVAQLGVSKWKANNPEEVKRIANEAQLTAREWREDHPGILSRIKQEMGPRRDSTSGFKGVSWHNPSQKYRALIRVNSKRLFLGYFTTPESAAKAYNEAALKNFGKHAYQNPLP